MPTLQFKGKTFVQNHHLAVKYHQLVPKKDLSLTDNVSLHDNLIIQGDNLKALKALLPTYAGKIKCIYIDPPYNTGNDNGDGKGWIYNDNVNSPMIKEWLGKEVNLDDLTRHDKWLCMMMPRLKMLKELLSEDGVIFISIDNNEIHRLRLLMDEIFEEFNCITELVWQKRKGGGNDSFFFAVDHEYILVYAKNKQFQETKWKTEYTEEYLKRYNAEDDKSKFYWDTLSRAGLNNPIIYDVDCPDGTIIKNGTWQVSEKTFATKKSNGDIKFEVNRNGGYTVFHKVRLPKGKTFRSIYSDATNKNAADEMQILFENKKQFSNPKPVALVKTLISLVAEEDSIILDSFAGSATTAHAVLELNKEDGGNRKFILVEQEDYANTITAERVRRVSKGIKKAEDANLKKGLGGSFSYFELGNEIEMESILRGKNLPSFKEFARYLFYTATGEEFKEKVINEKTGFIGESKNYEVYLHYKPNIEWLKKNALTLEEVKAFPKFKSKQRLVFAPAKYVDDYTLLEHRIDFCQLPYEIYRIQK